MDSFGMKRRGRTKRSDTGAERMSARPQPHLHKGRHAGLTALSTAPTM